MIVLAANLAPLVASCSEGWGLRWRKMEFPKQREDDGCFCSEVLMFVITYDLIITYNNL